ncbi:MAG: VTT domain-containing protein [Candidatus Izemoplasmatales bacterium]|nr:VTT domain-containing protein [Candidatus Izemoplasmatales bacterium]
MQFFNELMESIKLLIQEHFWLAPLFGVLLPFIEALLPTIPLTVIIATLYGIFTTAFGVLEGTLLTIFLSLIGSFLGMFLIFIIIRATFADYFFKKVQENKYGRVFLNVVEGKKVFVVLMLLSNPFLPSSVLNYALSLTKVKVSKYIFLTLTSRLIIILFLVFLGSIFNIREHPLNVLWMMLVYFILLGVWIIYIRSRKNDDRSVFKETKDK